MVIIIVLSFNVLYDVPGQRLPLQQSTFVRVYVRVVPNVILTLKQYCVLVHMFRQLGTSVNARTRVLPGKIFWFCFMAICLMMVRMKYNVGTLRLLLKVNIIIMTGPLFNISIVSFCSIGYGIAHFGFLVFEA